MNGVLAAGGPAGMHGQQAVVTGAARGIGARIARELAWAGASVTVLDIHDPAETVAAIVADGGTASGQVVDVTDLAAVRRALAGLPRLDVLVTSAAVYGDTVALDDLDESEVDLVLGVNVKGTLWTIKAALPLLRHPAPARTS
ncbi:SDR family NAD(P)-dependent oxidoreductase [Amycolatopsis sp. NPDC006131]|uniref:SDR family NAD(P)-dependent oxidoreductase n=1 Tax=Amycolatopsis sp. NPDC006131 TaxID=3156731 RepID=UPI0033A32364